MSFHWAIRCLLFVLSSFSAQAGTIKVITVNSQDLPVAPRWMWSSAEEKQVPERLRPLLGLKKLSRGGDPKKCILEARRLRSRFAEVVDWIRLEELSCARSLVSEVKVGDELAVQSFKEAERAIEASVWSASHERLKMEWLQLGVALLENSKSLGSTQRWGIFDRIQRLRSRASVELVGRMDLAGGMHAQSEQDFETAEKLVERSLGLRATPEARGRLAQIRSLKNKAARDRAKPEGAEEGPSNDIRTETSIDATAKFLPSEKEIADRLSSAVIAGDWISALSDGVELTLKSPGGTAGNWASDQVLNIYLNLIRDNSADFAKVIARAVTAMAKADGKNCYRWGLNAYVRGRYKDALELSRSAVTKSMDSGEAAKTQILAADSARQVADLNVAKDYYSQAIERHFGSDESKEAMFRLGLMSFQQRDWSAAASWFEKLLAMAQPGKHELSAGYWLWRSLERFNPPRAKAQADELLKRFPLSYYGLRARFESAAGEPVRLGLKSTKADIARWPMSAGQARSWSRVRMLLEAGWFKEAEAELMSLPIPQSPKDRAIFGQMLVRAFSHMDGLSYILEFVETQPLSMHEEYLRSAFPIEFKVIVDQEASRQGISPDLILGVIRQESTYRSDVTSPAGARGLMQLIPSTAQEVASLLRLQTYAKPEDLFDPNLNIRLGASYLQRMIKGFSGHVPLGLAAYNAGPGRLRRWLQARIDLGNVEEVKNSAPESEVWIEEMPWSETQYYVKAVLRNLIIFQNLNQGQGQLADPVWR